MTIKWIEVNCLLRGQYSANKNTRSACMCVYSKGCNFIKEIITIKGNNFNNRTGKIFNFENEVSFRSCV